jgi:hypothetical protein
MLSYLRPQGTHPVFSVCVPCGVGDHVRPGFCGSATWMHRFPPEVYSHLCLFSARLQAGVRSGSREGGSHVFRLTSRCQNHVDKSFFLIPASSMASFFLSFYHITCFIHPAPRIFLNVRCGSRFCPLDPPPPIFLILCYPIPRFNFAPSSFLVFPPLFFRMSTLLYSGSHALSFTPSFYEKKSKEIGGDRTDIRTATHRGVSTLQDQLVKLAVKEGE